jgi:hypothetical protein
MIFRVHHIHKLSPEAECFLNSFWRSIMSAVSEYAAAQKAFNAQLHEALDGIHADVEALKAKIDQLQNNPGPISPADQALLDELQSEAAALVARTRAVDDLTPPEIPPVEEEPV